MQLPAAVITQIHKNAPAAEFGARVQMRADAGNAWLMSLSFAPSISAMIRRRFIGFLARSPWLCDPQCATVHLVGLTTKALRCSLLN
jgi:hypothetical protein